jgi:hypothetical protein
MNKKEFDSLTDKDFPFLGIITIDNKRTFRKITKKCESESFNNGLLTELGGVYHHDLIEIASEEESFEEFEESLKLLVDKYYSKDENLEMTPIIIKIDNEAIEDYKKYMKIL